MLASNPASILNHKHPSLGILRFSQNRKRSRPKDKPYRLADGDGLYLNGHRVVLKGADRHSFWPDSGRCLSDAVHRLDIQALKDAHMNAVRMSHYPPDERFLELCDELGIYVLDELAG